MWFQSIAIKAEKKSHFKKRKRSICVYRGTFFFQLLTQAQNVKKYPYVVKSFLKSQEKKNKFPSRGL